MSSLTLEQQAYDMSLIARIDALRTAARRFPLSLLEFGMRLAVGATFFRSGMTKYEDFANAIVLGGFRIPALRVRRTDTEIELKENQSFAIAGLYSSELAQTRKKIPLIGDIPGLGYLFQSKNLEKRRSELLVVATPMLVSPNMPGQAPAPQTGSPGPPAPAPVAQTCAAAVVQARTMSRIDSSPVTSPPSTTSRCRKPPRTMA